MFFTVPFPLCLAAAVVIVATIVAVIAAAVVIAEYAVAARGNKDNDYKKPYPIISAAAVTEKCHNKFLLVFYSAAVGGFNL